MLLSDSKYRCAWLISSSSVWSRLISICHPQPSINIHTNSWKATRGPVDPTRPHPQPCFWNQLAQFGSGSGFLSTPTCCLFSLFRFSYFLLFSNHPVIVESIFHLFLPQFSASPFLLLGRFLLLKCLLFGGSTTALFLRCAGVPW